MPHVQSTAIRSIVYDAAGRTLFVIFIDGDRYAYLDVPPETYAAFMAAESKGRFFAAHVRDLFEYHQLP